MYSKSFKKFVEEKENSIPYIDALRDEFGIDQEDFENEPQIASFFSLGKDIRNIGPYRIIKFIKNNDGKTTHAVIERYDDSSIKNKKYSYEKEKIVRKYTKGSKEKFIIPIEDLDKLMSQNFQPAPDASGAGMGMI